MKKRTGFFLILAVLLMVCLAAAAEKQGTCGKNISWRLDDQGVMYLSGSGAMEDGVSWREGVDKNAIKKLIIGDGITRIGTRAFETCEALRSVSIPDSVEELGKLAFNNCNALNSLTLPGNISKIGIDALLMETEVLYAPFDSVTARTMGRQDLAFYIKGTSTCCQYLFNETGEETGLRLCAFKTDGETAKVPDGVTEIDSFAFRNCPNAVRIVIPDSVRSLATPVFAGLKREFYLVCSEGSRAEAFALDQGLQYDNGKKQVIGWNIKKASEKISWIVRNYIRSGMSEKKKALVLHNWLINNCHYDETKKCHDENILLTEGYGVCEAYANAYHSLLSKAGVASGNFDSDSMDHRWSVVRIDGKWYHVDCTWDDPTVGPKNAPPISGTERQNYFLLRDAQMKKDHQWDSYLSADRFLIMIYYDPSLGRDVPRLAWYTDGMYRVDWATRTCDLYFIYEYSLDKFDIPDKIKCENTLIPVISILDNAGKGNRFLKTVTIGKNVKSIGKNAFLNCKKLSTITIRTSKLKLKTVGDNAFKGISGKAVFHCPAKMLKAYKKLFLKRGAPKTALFK